jgi:hypothetical protein
MMIDDSVSPDCPHAHIDEEPPDPAANIQGHAVCEDCGANLAPSPAQPLPDGPVQTVDPWATTAPWDAGVPF